MNANANSVIITRAGAPDLEMAEPSRENVITLGVLDTVDSNSHLTQRHIAHELGIALGLANAYLKRCIRKGLVKVRQAPAKRYSYYLTPKGLSEKTRLTAEFFSQSLRFFRVVRSQYGEIFAASKAQGHDRVVLWGRSDVAEIALLCANEQGVTVLGLLVDEAIEGEAYGLTTAKRLEDFPNFHAVVVTDARVDMDDLLALRRSLGADRVHVASILGLRLDGGGAAP